MMDDDGELQNTLLPLCVLLLAPCSGMIREANIHLLQGEREMVSFAFSLVQEPGTIVYYVDLVLRQESLKSEEEMN